MLRKCCLWCLWHLRSLLLHFQLVFLNLPFKGKGKGKGNTYFMNHNTVCSIKKYKYIYKLFSIKSLCSRLQTSIWARSRTWIYNFLPTQNIFIKVFSPVLCNFIEVLNSTAVKIIFGSPWVLVVFASLCVQGMQLLLSASLTSMCRRWQKKLTK